MFAARRRVAGLIGDLPTKQKKSLKKNCPRLSRPLCTNSSPKLTENAQVSKTFRYPIAWKDPDFYDAQQLEHEVRRVFDVCHGCRLCYSLCDSFPKLFDLIDDSKTGELDSVPSSDFKPIADSCTLCDICFLNKCPYTPPHGLNVDFPHLILRLKALDNKDANISGIELKRPTTFAGVKESTGTKLSGGAGSGSLGSGSVHVQSGIDRSLVTTPQPFFHSLYTHMDLINPIASAFSFVVNWMTKTTEKPNLFRKMMQKIAQINQDAKLPEFVPPNKTLVATAKKSITTSNNPYKVNKQAPAYAAGEKVILYATCNGNYNKPHIGNAFRALLAKHGVVCQVEYEGCCGMPQLEAGKLKEVASKAKLVSSKLRQYVDQGYTIVTTVSSCTLMFKKDWPLMEPEDENIKALSEKTMDMSEYLIKLQKLGFLEKPAPLEKPSHVTLHHACHARAQNMGFKSQQLLEMIPELTITSVERCSGHGGSFGVQTEGHKIAMKVGKPVINKTLRNIEEIKEDSADHFIASDCPLAVDHLVQGVQNLAHEKQVTLSNAKLQPKHPVEILAASYKITSL